MAEIHVEPRGHGKAWLWLLLLVVVLVVAGWILFGSGTVQVGAIDRAADAVVALAQGIFPGGFHG
ncbi:MAG: hypothetical protein ACYC1S_14000 [Gemmatimonadaceae bacterium]